MRVDVALEMTRATLDVLERTIFTQGLPGDPDALGRAITRFLEAVGPIDPLDVFGMPDFIPRIGRLRARPAGRYFAEIVDELITRRRALMETAEAPQDLLTLLLAAQDPETGNGLTDLAVRANIATFIAAGHETTANALTWALYCLSQDEAAQEQVEAEIDAAGEGDFALDALPFTRAVVEEGMRLFPPVPFLSRQAIEPDRFGRIKVPKGSLVLIAPGCCTATTCSGTSRMPSCRSGSCPVGGSRSRASPICRSGRVRVSASGRASRCRRRRSSSPTSSAPSASACRRITRGDAPAQGHAPAGARVADGCRGEGVNSPVIASATKQSRASEHLRTERVPGLLRSARNDGSVSSSCGRRRG